MTPFGHDGWRSCCSLALALALNVRNPFFTFEGASFAGSYEFSAWDFNSSGGGAEMFPLLHLSVDKQSRKYLLYRTCLLISKVEN